MPDSGNSLVTPTATTAGSTSISSMSSAGLPSAPALSSASSTGSFADAQRRHLQDTEEERQAALDSGSDFIAGTPGLSKGLTRPLAQVEKDRLAYLDRLKYFLATAPSRWSSAEVDQNGMAGPTPFAPNVNLYPTLGVDGSYASHPALNTPSHPQLNRFMLPSQEFVTCVLWNGLYHITGTDIVRALVFRFEAFGRPVKNMKKFEEGVFSDLRNLKPGVDASLEEPKSPFLDLLFKYQCIRTQKKQKVFYWFSVPHDRLFLDALDRDLKREKMQQEPTTIVTGEPALSFTYDSKRTLYEQFSQMLGARDGESEFDRNVRLAVKDSRRSSDSVTDGEDSNMEGGGTADESENASEYDDERRPGSSMGKQIFGHIMLIGSRSYKHRKRNAASKRGSRHQDDGERRGRADSIGSTGARYASASASRERHRAAATGYDSMMDEFGPGSIDARQQSEPSLSAADYFLKQAKGELLPADGVARKTRINQPIGEVGVYYSEGAPPPPSSASSVSSHEGGMSSALSLDGSAPMLDFSHLRSRSMDGGAGMSSHAHRHSYHGETSSFGAALGPISTSFSQSSASTSTRPLPRSSMTQPPPVSSTAMYEQHGPDGKIKAFVCPLFSCGRLFKRMEHLKRHLRTHTMERPFACNKCEKKFSRSDNLNQHLRTHEKTGGALSAETNTDGYASSGGAGGDMMEDDSEQEEARGPVKVSNYPSGGESDDDALFRFGAHNSGFYGDSLGLHTDVGHFTMAGGFSGDLQMRELEARDVHEVQGDEEGLLMVSPGGFNSQFYQPPTMFGGSLDDSQWSSGPSGSTFGFEQSAPRGNRASLPGYMQPLHRHSANSSISSQHSDDLASYSAPSDKAGFDPLLMYPPGMMMDDGSAAGGPIRRHRSVTPLHRTGDPIRRPLTSNSNEYLPGSTPSSVGSSRGYHPYGGYNSTSRGGSAHSSPALQNIPLANDFGPMRNRNSFSGSGMLIGGDVTMNPPDLGFGDGLYRTESPALVPQSESPAPYSIDLPGAYGASGFYGSSQPSQSTTTMSNQFGNQQQQQLFGDQIFPQHVSTL